MSPEAFRVYFTIETAKFVLVTMITIGNILLLWMDRQR
jgi:hypothetical protein